MYAFYKKHEYFFIIAFVLISQLVVLPELRDRYPDTDNYTHARRVLDLILSKNWAETPYMHTNYPFGEILHFTRITDIFWLFFSLPAFLFFPLKEAVFWGGYIYQAGVLILSALALTWGLKPVAGPILRLIGVCLFFVQPSVTETYILIKPDHHALTAFFVFITTGGLIRYLYLQNEKDLRLAGIAAGLCLWTSIEGLLVSYGLLAALVLLFLFNRTAAKNCAVFYFYYFISSFVFLIINPPFEGIFFPDNGRLSFLLVVIIGFSAAAMLILSLLEERHLLTSFWRRSGAVLLTAAFFIGLLFVFFPPAVVFNPYFPPFIKEVWAKNIVELQPATKETVLFFLGSMPSVLSIVIGFGIFKFCSDKQRNVLILSMIPLLFLTGLSFTAIRYARISSLFTPYVFVTAFSLRTANRDIGERKKGFFLSIIYVLFTAYLGINYISVNRSLTPRRPPMRIVKPYLPNTEGSILSDTSSGPEIIWELDEKVIGTPYHRNIEGITDNFWLYYADDNKLITALLKKHRVKAILVFVEMPDRPALFYNMQQRYSFFAKTTGRDSFLMKLLTGRDLPCGISEELNSPPPFVLFNVDFSKCSEDSDKTEKTKEKDVSSAAENPAAKNKKSDQNNDNTPS